METLATKYFTFLFLTIFGGGWTVPLGLPPAKEEPALARVAPEKCVFYASWAGMAAADAKSKSQTEQLLAEPEVQNSFAALATLVSNLALPELPNNMDYGPPVAVPRQPAPTNTRDHYDASRRATFDFIKIVATHPAAIFATEIKYNKDCPFANFQIVRGGMIVAAGQDAEKLRAAFDRFNKETTPPEPVPAATVGPKPPTKPPAKTRPIVREVQIAGHTWYRFTDPGPIVTFGFQGTDFILGAGEGSVEEILKRRQQEPPAWLVDLRKQLPVERVSTVVYVNLKMLLEQMAADKAMPKTREALRRLGLDKLSALSSVSGLEGETFTSKLLLSTDRRAARPSAEPVLRPAAAGRRSEAHSARCHAGVRHAF